MQIKFQFPPVCEFLGNPDAKVTSKFQTNFNPKYLVGCDDSDGECTPTISVEFDDATYKTCSDGQKVQNIEYKQIGLDVSLLLIDI